MINKVYSKKKMVFEFIFEKCVKLSSVKIWVNSILNKQKSYLKGLDMRVILNIKEIKEELVLVVEVEVRKIVKIVCY